MPAAKAYTTLSPGAPEAIVVREAPEKTFPALGIGDQLTPRSELTYMDATRSSPNVSCVVATASQPALVSSRPQTLRPVNGAPTSVKVAPPSRDRKSPAFVPARTMS